MVPAASGRKTDRTIRRSRRSQNRSEPRNSIGPGQTLSVVTGFTKSLVTIRLRLKSTSMP